MASALAPAAPAPGAPPPGDDPAPSIDAAAARNQSLRHELELAEGDGFYLLLDADAGIMTLMYKGAPLRETPLRSAEIGEPRARHGEQGDTSLDIHRPWTGGTLVPPRLDVREEVVPPPVGGEAAGAAELAPQGEFVEGGAPEGAPTTEPEEEQEVEIPKTPEELYPVPHSYEIRFAEGLVVEVVRAEPDGGGDEPSAVPIPAPVAGDPAVSYPPPPRPGLWQRLVGLFRRAALVRPPGERVRLRVVVDSLAADRLFRSLPPDVSLLIRRPADAS